MSEREFALFVIIVASVVITVAMLYVIKTDTYKEYDD